MVDELTVLSRHVSGEMKPILEKGLKTTQAHLEKSRQIWQQLSGEKAAFKTETEAQVE
jgi:hypothetical protein